MKTSKLIITIQISLVLISFIFSNPVFAQTELKEGIQLVGLDGFKYEVKFQGKKYLEAGVPVVVFEAGGGGGDLREGSWTTVLDSVAQFAPVFSYTRSGLGNSEWNGIEPTPKNIAMLLHKLLEKLELPKPYVLVGHSRGGIIIRAFGGYFSDDVKALIFVDPTDFLQTEDEENEIWKNMGVELEVVEKFFAESNEFFATEEKSEGVVAENDVFDKFHKQSLEERNLGPIPNVPMALLFGTKEPPFEPRPIEGIVVPFDFHEWVKYSMENRIKYFGRWPLVFKNLYVVISPNAWHHFQNDEPEMVLDMIRRMTEK